MDTSKTLILTLTKKVSFLIHVFIFIYFFFISQPFLFRSLSHRDYVLPIANVLEEEVAIVARGQVRYTPPK